ncbi:LacI family DNA-binding transcriptional regulator [Mycobacterium sp. NPDC048908]|uniref:LacI family DNA-binding transcriptional regulator n=1 Tax=Mycobacterium sp. NPDC048908 TaxID=3364292 RepID=UPI00371D5F6C
MTAEPAPRRPVMADVAKLAGVSHQTVSRVINGSASIRPSTRERVERAIAHLGYRPNTAARALVTRRSKIIGIIGSNTALYGPTSIQFSIQDAARAAGYFTSLVTLAAVTHDELRGALDYLGRQSVEAIVMIVTQQDALAVVRSEATTIPLIVVEGELSGRGLSVGVDQAEGARLATQHLIDLGHRDIVHVSGPLTWTEARARRTGYVEVMQAARLPVLADLEGDWSPGRGYQIGRELADRNDFSAVFVANDQMAIGILQAFSQAGIRVPEDVSLIGFDDIPEAAYLNPALSTVRQDFHTVGRRAIELLTAVLDGVAATTPLLAPELVVRASTCPRVGTT